MKVLNGFSASMLPAEGEFEVLFCRLACPADFVANCIGYDNDYPQSAIGHADTAALVGRAIGHDLKSNRVNVTLSQGERALLAQYVGPRLPEGTTTLPEGARLDFFEVRVLARRNDAAIRESYAPSMMELARLQKLSPAELREEADRREAAALERARKEHRPGFDEGSGYGKNAGDYE